jgi:hypothetical protein
MAEPSLHKTMYNMSMTNYGFPDAWSTMGTLSWPDQINPKHIVIITSQLNMRQKKLGTIKNMGWSRAILAKEACSNGGMNKQKKRALLCYVNYQILTKLVEILCIRYGQPSMQEVKELWFWNLLTLIRAAGGVLYMTSKTLKRHISAMP